MADLSDQQSLSETIAKYYDETWAHYRFWLNKDNLAIHLGYADETTRSHSDKLKNMNRVLADRAKIMRGERILDAGCGVGGSSLWLAAERGANVVGITVSGQQVEMASNFAAQRGLSDQVHFERADFTATPFPDESFDVVWALESICYALRKVDFYREAARLLRPGGRVVVADGARAARPLSPRHERQLSKMSSRWAVPDLKTTTEHLEHAASAGFVDAQLEDVSENVRSSSRRLHRLGMLAYPVALACSRMSTQSAVRYNNVVAGIRQYSALKHGLCRYFVLTATKPAQVA